jgi:membrane associated rhomboid family serine protease
VALVLVNAAVLAAVDWGGDPRDPAVLVGAGALERGRLWHEGQLHRLVTAAFLHFGWIHLAWNAAAGLLLGVPLERALGTARFLGLYLASALGASALSLLGQDVVSTGASGPVFGLVGAVLALHRHHLGSWGAFLRSRATRAVLVLVVLGSAVAAVLVRVDHLAHAGGLLAGAGFAALLARPRGAPRAPWLAYAAALAALCAAATWPRDALTRFEGAELERALHAALTREDVPAARVLAARAAERGHDSEVLRYYRGLLRVQEGDLDGAAVLLRAVVASADGPLRDGARRSFAGVAKLLGYRHYTGDGAAKDPWLGLAYFEEACAAGDAESCGLARRIRGGPGP